MAQLRVICGLHHTLVIHNNKLYGCGSNAKGQLTSRLPKQVTVFTLLSDQLKLDANTVIADVVAGRELTIVWLYNKITQVNSFWHCGSQFMAAPNTIFTPIKMPFSSNVAVIKIVIGHTGYSYNHVLIHTHDKITQQDQLWGWGPNDAGELGIGTAAPQSKFFEIKLDFLRVNKQSLINVTTGASYTLLHTRCNETQRDHLWVSGEDITVQLALGPDRRQTLKFVEIPLPFLTTQKIVDVRATQPCSGQVKTDTLFKRNCFSNCAGLR
jgi:alpha-tubulin suppressor-like RCC1 family protein